MVLGLRRHLWQMGDTKHLVEAAYSAQPLADRGRNRAPYSHIDFIENQYRHLIRFARTDFRASMTRDNSPPDATREIG